MIRWTRDKQILKETLDYNIERLKKTENNKMKPLLVDFIILLKDHLKVLDTIEILKDISDFEDFECGYEEYCNRYGDNKLTESKYDSIKEMLGL